jgi:hypothetical protein
LQVVLNSHCERVLATKHAPSNPCRIIERRHGLAEIVERGAFVSVERMRINPTHLEREFIIISDNALCYGYLSAQQRLNFFAAL